MKRTKWIILLTALIALLFTGFAYAGGSPEGNNGGDRNARTENGDQLCRRQGVCPEGRVEPLRQRFREQNRVIRENEEQCSQLKRQIRERCRDMQNCLQQQRNRENLELNQGQAAKINESLQQLRERNAGLRDERGCCNKQMASMKRHRKAGNKDAMAADLDNIAKAQIERIQALEETLNELDTLDAALSELNEK